MDLRPFYFNALENTGRIVAGVQAEQLAADTPCEGWSLRELINHLIGGVYLFERALAGEKNDPHQTPPDLAGDDPGVAFENARKLAVEGWSADGALERQVHVFGEMPATGALRIALMEAVVHGWDVAKATGQDYGIEPMLATAMLDGLKKVYGDAPRGDDGFFAPEVEVPENASPEDKLVAFLGRRP
ncbi:MAG: TIGR03086 family metal-binding protein [Actinomycetota bacterium]|nr:TIGR03086 family protein [Actinomycetota bacterium]